VTYLPKNDNEAPGAILGLFLCYESGVFLVVVNFKTSAKSLESVKVRFLIREPEMRFSRRSNAQA